MNVIRMPEPVACYACAHKYIGSQCPVCKEERPAFTALKAETDRARGAQPIKNPLPACRYAPAALCDCGGRGLCLDVA